MATDAKTIVYKFGLLPPTFNAKVIEEELWRNHTYSNKLIAVERKRRQLVREAEAPYGIRELYGQISDIRAQRKAGEIEPDEAEKRIKELCARIDKIREDPDLRRRMFEIEGGKTHPVFFDPVARAKHEAEKEAKKELAKKLRKMTKQERAEYKRKNKKKRTGGPRTPNNSIINTMLKEARAESGLFWGNYSIVEDAHNDIKKSNWCLYDGYEDADPKFRPWRREGTVANQLQVRKGVAVKKEDIFTHTENTYVTIKPIDEDKLVHSPRRGDRLKARRTTLWMAISGRRKGIDHAEWPIFIHRPIPDGANIKWVKVSKRMVGPKAKWTCEITVEFPEDFVRSDRPKHVGSGTVAVVLGWRRVRKDYLRVATWMSADGNIGTLELLDAYKGGRRPARKNRRKDVDGGYGGVIDGIRRVNEVQKVRDNNFNEARDELVEFLRAYSEKHSLPEWILRSTVKRSSKPPTVAQALAYIKQWKSSKRLGAFVRRWAHNRFDHDSTGDDLLAKWKTSFAQAQKKRWKHRADNVRIMVPTIPSDLTGFASLEAWRYHDYHLWVWTRSQDSTSRKRRKEVYRNFAADLARRFAHVIVDGTDFKAVREKKAETEAETGKPKPQTIGHVVACGEARLALQTASSHYGAKYTLSEATNTAQRCPACGAVDKAHRDPDNHDFACTTCGFVRDVATVRILNMLAAEGHEKDVERIVNKQEGSLDKLEEAIHG